MAHNSKSHDAPKQEIGEGKGQHTYGWAIGSCHRPSLLQQESQTYSYI